MELGDHIWCAETQPKMFLEKLKILMKNFFFDKKSQIAKQKSGNFRHFRNFSENVENFQIFFAIWDFCRQKYFSSFFYIFPKIHPVYCIVTKYECITPKTLKFRDTRTKNPPGPPFSPQNHHFVCELHFKQWAVRNSILWIVSTKISNKNFVPLPHRSNVIVQTPAKPVH